MSYWKMRVLVLGATVIALAAIACGSDAASSPTATVGPAGDPPPADPTSDEGQLTLARARWASLDISDYVVTMSLQCFCPFGVSKAVNLKVRDGVITSGTHAPGSETNTVIELKRFRTVEGLFDFVADAIEQEAHSITASYHPEYGYPESVFVDFVSNIADEENGFTIEKITAPELGNTAGDDLATTTPAPTPTQTAGPNAQPGDIKAVFSPKQRVTGIDVPSTDLEALADGNTRATAGSV